MASCESVRREGKAALRERAGTAAVSFGENHERQLCGACGGVRNRLDGSPPGESPAQDSVYARITRASRRSFRRLGPRTPGSCSRPKRESDRSEEDADIPLHPLTRGDAPGGAV